MYSILRLTHSLLYNPPAFKPNISFTCSEKHSQDTCNDSFSLPLTDQQPVFPDHGPLCHKRQQCFLQWLEHTHEYKVNYFNLHSGNVTNSIHCFELHRTTLQLYNFLIHIILIQLDCNTVQLFNKQNCVHSQIRTCTQAQILKLHALRTVPTIVSGHMFCTS